MALTIKGMDSLLRKLDALGGSCIEALGKAVKTTTMAAQTSADRIVPVAKIMGGTLKQSLRVRFESSATSKTGVVFTNVPYAIFVELGTYKMVARPFMQMAAMENEPVFIDEAQSELKDAIRRVAK